MPEFRQLVQRVTEDHSALLAHMNFPLPRDTVHNACVALNCGALARGSEDSRTGPGVYALHSTFLRGLSSGQLI